MTEGEDVFQQIQNKARSDASKEGRATPTAEYLTRHALSTGDPIIPPPRQVRVPRVLGAEIEILGYAPETTIAEKGVTILERGITSTRWRDYIDIV